MTIPRATGERFLPGGRKPYFLRVRLYDGGQAQYIKELFEDERDLLNVDLVAARESGDEAGAADCAQKITWLEKALFDVNTGLLDFVGPDEP